MKKSSASLLALLLALMMVLTACNGSGSGSSTSTPSTDSGQSEAGDGGDTQPGDAVEGEAGVIDQKIIWAVHNEADTLDPNISNNTFASPVLSNVFEGLMTYDQDNSLVTGVAQSYEVSDDGLTYTFTLRDGLKWSDGSDLVAGDFIYSWTRTITPATGGKYSSIITDYVANAQEYFDGTADIEEVGFEAPDDKTVIITLNAPTPYFLSLLTMYTWAPVQQAAIEANPETWAQNADSYVCNGPFKPGSIDFGEGVTLVKNEHYYDADVVQLEEINLRLIPENSTALTAFEAGTIDGFYEVPLDDIPRLKAESDSMYTIPQFGHTYFMFNLQNEVLSDVRVRQALILAIDRNQIIDSVLQTTDIPATGLVPPGYVLDGKDYTDGRPDYGISSSANVEEAQRLLAEAGYPDGEGFPAMRLAYYTDPNVKKYTEAIHQMWKNNLGIDLEITTEEWKVYYDSVQAMDFEICAMGWGGDYLHPMTFLETFLSNSVNNNSKYDNAEYDRLVREVAGLTDAAAGVDLMLQAEQILVGDDYGFIPLYYRSRVFMMADTVKDWKYSALNKINFKYAYEAEA